MAGPVVHLEEVLCDVRRIWVLKVKQTGPKQVEVWPKFVQINDCCIRIKDLTIRFPIHLRQLDTHGVFPATTQRLCQPVRQLQFRPNGYILRI